MPDDLSSLDAAELERRAAANEQNMSIQRQLTGEQRAADSFVDGVMASDVFPNDQRFAVGIENTGGVNSTRAREVRLVRAQFVRQ